MSLPELAAIGALMVVTGLLLVRLATEKDCKLSGNGCAHVNTTRNREGNDSVITCDACGKEMSRVVDYYDD